MKNLRSNSRRLILGLAGLMMEAINGTVTIKDTVTLSFDIIASAA